MLFQIETSQEFRSFQRLAKELINSYRLIVNDGVAELYDLEFYWHDRAEHRDGSAHKQDYSGGQLRPHGSGLDITLSGTNGAFGGILIRGVMVEDSAVYGLLLSASKILSLGGRLTGEELQICLEKRTEPGQEKVFATTRIGLGKNVGDYIDRRYRFVCCNINYLQAVKGKEKLYKDIVREYPEFKEEAASTLGYIPQRLEKLEWIY